MKSLAVRSRVGTFVEAVHQRMIIELRGLLDELSGEKAYSRYVAGRRRRRFPEEGIMTRREYGHWRAKTQEEKPEIRC